VGTRHLLQESGSEIRRSGRSANGALRGAIGVFMPDVFTRRAFTRRVFTPRVFTPRVFTWRVFT
jgi:hypothetical protein